jgi:hypothetical protein
MVYLSNYLMMILILIEKESPLGMPDVNASILTMIIVGDTIYNLMTSLTLQVLGINGILLGGKGCMKFISL